jgi:hypothetical protein
VEESTTYQYVLRQGGIKVAREIIVDLGQNRCGRPDAAAMAVLNGITNLDRLKRMARKIHRVNSWKELFRTR